MRLRFILLLCLSLAAAVLIAQSNLGSVEGKVVNSVTGESIKKAVVTIHNRNNQYVYFTTTDQSGKFHIDNVQPEKYVASADAEGYANSRTVSDVKLFTVSADPLSGVEVPIAPLSVITGKVVDEDGEPLDGVTIMALRNGYNAGAKTLQQVSAAQTDDRGIYRMFDVQPGRYYLSAQAQRQFRMIAPQNAERTHTTIPEEAYGIAIYPGVAEISQATAHELKPGADWTGADFKLHKRPAYHIRGRANGLLAAGGRGNVQAEPCNPDPMPWAGGLQNIVGRQDGSFDLAGAVSGTYCLIVREPGRGGVALTQPVTVTNADVNDVTLNPPASFSVKGMVTIDGTPPANMPTLGISLRSSDGNQQQHVQVTAGAAFQIDYIFPGKYTVVVPSVQQVYVKSILYGSQDVSSGVIPDAQPGGSLAITLGTDPGEIDGTVQAGSVESGTPVLVLAIPDDAHAQRNDLMRITNSSAEGTFTLQGLAPGDYKVFALATQDYEDYQNRELLKLLEGNAAAVTVHANGHEQASLTPIPTSEINRAKEKL
jgi:Carboxypeptidase regulatory-like domain